MMSITRPILVHRITVAVVAVLTLTVPTLGQPFQGLDSATLEAVADSAGQWGLKIVVMNVGQADAILVLTPNGDVCLIDSGKTIADGNRIVDYMESPPLNGVGALRTIDLLYTTHYDQDHIGGIKRITERGVRIRKAFDQGNSNARSITTPTGLVSAFGKYVTAVGDPNGNLIQDATEPGFMRHRIAYGHVERIGLEDEVEIRCVAERNQFQTLANGQRGPDGQLGRLTAACDGPRRLAAIARRWAGVQNVDRLSH